jgi:dihydroorotate dehydrogenase electron transfer subunit
LGNGFPAADGRVLLIGGGLGLPPLLYTAQILEKKCDAALGFRDEASALLIPDFAEVCHDVRVTTDDGSLGVHGNALTAASQLAGSSEYDAVYVCGSLPLLKAAAAWGAEQRLPVFVSLEERMACGVGACLVCACAASTGYKRVCADGPVFPAEEVNWS